MYKSENNEPSGVRLVRLINTHLLDIAKREDSNRDRLCLYSTGTYWVGFERSAYYLSKLFPDLESLICNHPAFPFPIIALSVPAEMFLKYKTNHIAIRKKEDYEEYKADVINLKEYGTWHRQMVKEYEEELR